MLCACWMYCQAGHSGQRMHAANRLPCCRTQKAEVKAAPRSTALLNTFDQTLPHLCHATFKTTSAMSALSSYTSVGRIDTVTWQTEVCSTKGSRIGHECDETRQTQQTLPGPTALPRGQSLHLHQHRIKTVSIQCEASDISHSHWAAQRQRLFQWI